MKFILEHRHHQPSPAFAALLKQQFELLCEGLDVDEAGVLVERRLQANPPFRVAAHLLTAGPDVLAEGTDYTLPAALEKMIAQLEAHLVLCKDLRKFESQRNRTAMQRNRDDSDNGSPETRQRAAPPQDVRLSLRLQRELPNSPVAIAGVSTRTQSLLLAALRFWEHRNRGRATG